MDVDPPICDISTKVTFQNFCDICERIKKEKGKQNKGPLLSEFFNHCRKADVPDKYGNVYPILRLFLPQCERERGPYGIKEYTFAKIYIRILSLPKQGLDAQKLVNYKAPSSSTDASADFADIAYWVLKSRSRSSCSDITVADINECLDKIALFHGDNQPRAVDDEFTKLISRLTALQQKWLIRIILKDMKLGMGSAKILSCFHFDAPDLYDSSNSLSKVCSTLYKHEIRLNEIEVEMFSPYRPMLSDRLDIKKIKSVIKKDEVYYLEKKFDGERFQIHMKDGRFKYFSRNAFDYTSNYGESFDGAGTLTKYLKDLLDSSVRSFIVDGEMMGWHKTRNQFSSKGINFDVKKLTDNSSFKPCFCAFDILVYNDVILTNKPLRERMEYLDKLFVEKEGVFMRSKRIETQSSDLVIQELNRAIDEQDEGVVLKNIMSPYKPNNRKGGWFKIKPEYTEGVMNELDFIIIGGYYNENKRYGEIGSVLLGVADDNKNENGEPRMFYSAGRVKLTLVREDFEELCDKLRPHWNVVQKDTDPSTVSWTKDKPDVWIEPKNSFILQVKASELVKSIMFKTEYTVRFPRIVQIRYDKPWYDCLTMSEFRELTQNSHGVEKLTARNIGSQDIEKSSEISPRKKTKLMGVSSQFQPASTENVSEKSNIFSGKEFCVITGNDGITKAKLEIKVFENGGQFVQNPGINTFCIIAGDKNARVTNVVKSGEYNVATVDWFLKTIGDEYIKRGKLLKWTPKDLMGMSRETVAKFSLKYDKYGDSFARPTDMESLQYSLKKAKESLISFDLLPVEMCKLDRELFNGPSPYSFFRMCNIYFLSSSENAADISKMNIMLYGGKCCENVDSSTTHIVLSSVPDINDISMIEGCLKGVKDKPVVVTMDWMNKCLLDRTLVPTSDYEMILFNDSEDV